MATALVTGIFENGDDAAAAIAALTARGISRDAINVLAGEDAKIEAFGVRKKSHAGEGAAIGAGTLGTVGALVAGFTAVGAIATGGIGLLAAGPIVAALAGAGAGAATGGVLGGLIGLGIPEHEVKFFENSVSKGSVLVGVKTAGADAGEIRRILKDHGALDTTDVGAVRGGTKTARTNGVANDNSTAVRGELWAGGNGLKSLFVSQLKDIYYAEKQILEALPTMRDKAAHAALVQGLNDHIAETRTHVTRLEQVFRSIGVEADEERCPAINGILAECKELMAMDETPATRDAAIVCGGQKVEHYEMSTYGCLKAYAQQLGLSEAEGLLDQTLEEEKAADEKLSQLAESSINAGAAMAVQP